MQTMPITYVPNPNGADGNDGGGGSGANQLCGGAWSDPNGNITPPDKTSVAIYLQDSASPVNQWGWSVTNQNWFPIVT